MDYFKVLWLEEHNSVPGGSETDLGVSLSLKIVSWKKSVSEVLTAYIIREINEI